MGLAISLSICRVGLCLKRPTLQGRRGDTEVSLNLGSWGMSGQEELRVGEWMRMWLSRSWGIERVGEWGRRHGGWGKECKGQCHLSMHA